MNIKPISEDTYRKYVENLLPPKARCVLSVVEYPDPDDYGRGIRQPEEKKLCRDAIINALLTCYRERGLVLRGQNYLARLPHSLGDIYTLLTVLAVDEDWGRAWVESPKEYRNRKEKEEREACEGLAAMIARKYNVRGNTLDFVRAVYKHYRSISRAERHFRDDGERRAERYAMCVLGGAGRDAFFEDNDFATDRIVDAEESLRRLIRYLRHYCPLLMSQYDERKAKRKRK